MRLAKTRLLPWAPVVSIRKLEHLLGRNRADLRRIASYAGRYYEPFDLLAPAGTKWRHIDNPIGELKTLQSRIYRAVLAGYTFPANVVGGVPGFSILDNVTPHLERRCVATIDIRDCFPSIGDMMVFNALRKRLEFSEEVAALITRLTTFQHRLPQGAPSSSILANLVLEPLHRELDRIARAYGLRWTMYVDDITFSGDRADSAIGPIVRAIQHAGFRISHKKLHLMRNSDRQLVTGVVVNRRNPSAGRHRIEEIRRATLDMHLRDAASELEIRSLIGKVRYVGWIKKAQGCVLDELVEALTPLCRNDVDDRVRPARRRCSSISRSHSLIKPAS